MNPQSVAVQPTVLCLSGLDPTGGAGLQADIEACVANGAHALGVVTATTIQDSRAVTAVAAVACDWLQRQLDTLLADCSPAAVKIGLLGSVAQVGLIAELLDQLKVPVVCDPILRASGGMDLVNAVTAADMQATLFPLLTLATPNAAEARRLEPEADDLDACGQRLCAAGCAAVLITGGDESGDVVIDTLHRHDLPPHRWHQPRVAGEFHGTGCTLSSAVAARLAAGDGLETAIDTAQHYLHESLRHAFAIGHGRSIPRRRLP